MGRVESGTLNAGQDVVLAPSGRTARIRSIVTWPNGPRDRARAGESTGIIFEGPVFVDRGDVVAGLEDSPSVEWDIRARLLWLDRSALAEGRRLTLRSGTRSVKVEVTQIERVIDIESLSAAKERAAQQNDIVEVSLRTPELVALDTPGTASSLSRFILVDGLDIVGGGTVLERGKQTRSIVPAGHLVDAAARTARNGHAGSVIWLTGPPASGKSTLAMAVERKLFERGYQVFVLDGDNLRSGLNGDLGFAPEDRNENVRRAGELRPCFRKPFVVIAAFISPYARSRVAARAAAGKAFHEVYVHADAAVREARDPKGHYRAARSGNLPGFTGVTGEYEPPESPDLPIDTANADIPDATAMLLEYIVSVTRSSVEIDAGNV